MFLNTLTLETRNQWRQGENGHSRVNFWLNSTHHIILPNLKMQTSLYQEQLRQDDYFGSELQQLRLRYLAQKQEYFGNFPIFFVQLFLINPGSELSDLF